MQVLLAQIQAGSEETDFTRTRIAVFYAMDYSLGRYQQAIARIHRPRQTRPAVIHKLLMRRTPEEDIIRRLDERRDVIAKYNLYAAFYAGEKIEKTKNQLDILTYQKITL